MSDPEIDEYLTGQTPEPFHCAAVITCMGRLRHLRRSLPALLERSSMPVVLVDYSCPDGCGEWAEAEVLKHPHPLGMRLFVVSVPGQRHFNKCAALNHGLREAARQWPGWLLVLDADTIIGPGLEAWLRDNVLRGSFCFMQGHQARRDLSGLVAMHSSDYQRSGGYDEGFNGWGCEDWDMRCRLHFGHGLPFRDIPWQLAEPIAHSDAERSEHYATNKQASYRENWARLNANVAGWTGHELAKLDARAVRALFGGMW